MYDFDDVQHANDALWARVGQGLRAAGLKAPETLTRGADLWDIWQSPDLLLAQTCGYPFRARLHPHVSLVGTPDYGLEGCAPGQYYSVFVTRVDDPRTDLAAFDGAALAYNEPLSQSGWAAPQTHAAGLGLHFPAGLQTGAHHATILAIAEGQADFGAVDAVSWRHFQRFEAATKGLRVIGRTAAGPGLPLVTAQHAQAGLLLDITSTAIANLPEALRGALGLCGIVNIPAATYLAVPSPPPPQ